MVRLLVHYDGNHKTKNIVMMLGAERIVGAANFVPGLVSLNIGSQVLEVL